MLNLQNTHQQEIAQVEAHISHTTLRLFLLYVTITESYAIKNLGN